MMKSRLKLPKEQPPSCGPAAICALTGRSVKKVIAAIKAAATNHQRDLVDFANTNPRDLVEALNSFGWSAFNAKGVEVKPSSIFPPQVSAHARQQHPTIADFVASNERADLLIGIAYSLESSVSHTFVVDRKTFYDNNIGRRIGNPSDVDPDLANWRVLISYAIKPTPR